MVGVKDIFKDVKVKAVKLDEDDEGIKRMIEEIKERQRKVLELKNVSMESLRKVINI